MFDNVQDALVAKAQYIKNLETYAKAIDKEINLMDQRRFDVLVKAERQRQLLIDSMVRCDIKKIDHPTMAISLPKPRAKVEIFDEDILPETFWRVTEPEPKRSFNKDAIKEVLATDGEVPGARLTYKQKVVFK